MHLQTIRRLLADYKHAKDTFRMYRVYAIEGQLWAWLSATEGAESSAPAGAALECWTPPLPNTEGTDSAPCVGTIGGTDDDH